MKNTLTLFVSASEVEDGLFLVGSLFGKVADICDPELNPYGTWRSIKGTIKGDSIYNDACISAEFNCDGCENAYILLARVIAMIQRSCETKQPICNTFYMSVDSVED